MSLHKWLCKNQTTNGIYFPVVVYAILTRQNQLFQKEFVSSPGWIFHSMKLPPWCTWLAKYYCMVHYNHFIVQNITSFHKVCAMGLGWRGVLVGGCGVGGESFMPRRTNPKALPSYFIHRIHMSTRLSKSGIMWVAGGVGVGEELNPRLDPTSVHIISGTTY